MTKKQAVSKKNISKDIPQDAIQASLDFLQKQANEEKEKVPKREAAHARIEKLVDDLAVIGLKDDKKITAEMTAAFLVFLKEIERKTMKGDFSAQLSLAKFGGDVQKDLNDHLRKVNQDQGRARAVNNYMESFVRDTQPPAFKTGAMILRVIQEQPKDSHGKWKFALVPFMVDEDYNAKIMETLDSDLYVSMQVTPRDGLSGTFNIPAQYTKAGDPYDIFTTSAETKPGEPEKILHINGCLYKNGRIQQELIIPKILLSKKNSVAPEFPPFQRKNSGNDNAPPKM